MNARERYYWDLTGHLVVPGVLSEREVDDINRTLDYVIDSGAVSESEGGSRNSTFLQGGKTRWAFANLLDLPGDYASPIRPLLVHPEVVVRLRTMCGPGFRLDHGPQFQNARKGAEGLTLHGAGAPHRDFVAYHNQAGEMYCGGVTVTWNLTDCPAGGGGFAAAPGSHRSDFPMPAGVRDCDDDGGAVVQPEIRAGDCFFFMDGAQTHGTHPWQNDHERRSVLMKYASRTSIRQGRDLVDPDTHWDGSTVEGMSPVERAVMYGPASAVFDRPVRLSVRDDGEVVTAES